MLIQFIKVKQLLEVYKCICVVTSLVITRELKKLLYAHEWILMADSEERLRTKLVNRKTGMQAVGLKMNTEKTKVMFSCAIVNEGTEQSSTKAWNEQLSHLSSQKSYINGAIGQFKRPTTSSNCFTLIN